MKRTSAICAVILLVGLGACSKADHPMSTDSLPDSTEMTPVEHPRDVRPAPASSGMSSDPLNPSGLPGPSSGLGTSPNRY